MSATELLLFLTYLLSVCGSDDRFAYQDSPICASNDLKVSFGTPTSTFECETKTYFKQNIKNMISITMHYHGYKVRA